MGGVEILRTTTAEPTAQGIAWHVEKDLTDYAQLFAQVQTVSLSIPNNVDDTYTGVPLVSLSFTVYMPDAAQGLGLQQSPEIVALSNQPGNWDGLSVAAGSNRCN